jgi:major vault protein
MNISYKWNFEFDRTNKADSLKIFQVKDFYGDTCKAMASRIRGAASGNSFQVFREKSSEIIDSIIFKKDSNGKRIPFKFENNNLVITDVAIENLDPVDHQIEQSLNKSLNLTFEIENKARAAQANHTAAKLEQESRG